MTLRVIGAGVGRTGTTSLKAALEHLLGAPSYHMYEVFQHRDHIPTWHAAVRGGDVDWATIYGRYAATVDWPGAAFWRPLSERYPEALVLLSVRESADAWFASVDSTISALMARRPTEDIAGWHSMASELLATRFTPAPFERAAAIAAYERHNAEVRAAVPADRLLEWRPGDGWGPLCERLALPVPDEPFPRLNTSGEFHELLARLPAPPSRLARGVRRLRGALGRRHRR